MGVPVGAPTLGYALASRSRLRGSGAIVGVRRLPTPDTDAPPGERLAGGAFAPITNVDDLVVRLES